MHPLTESNGLSQKEDHAIRSTNVDTNFLPFFKSYDDVYHIIKI